MIVKSELLVSVTNGRLKQIWANTLRADEIYELFNLTEDHIDTRQKSQILSLCSPEAREEAFKPKKGVRNLQSIIS